MKQLIEDIKTNRHIDEIIDDDTYVEVINKYNEIFDFIHELGLISDEQYNDRWKFVYIKKLLINDDFACLEILIYLLKLAKNNYISYVDPVLVSYVLCNNDIWKLQEHLYTFNAYTESYYSSQPNFSIEGSMCGLFDNLMPAMFISETTKNILLSDNVSIEDKKIILAYQKVFENNKEELTRLESFISEWDKKRRKFSIEHFVSFSYAYFKINHMTVNNYEDIMNFINKLDKDFIFLYTKLDLLKINNYSELLQFFKMYYNEPIKERREIK